MQYEYIELLDNFHIDRFFDVVGDVADDVLGILSRHPNTTHRKLGNVEFKIDPYITYIKCSECGLWHPIFIQRKAALNEFYSGNDFPKDGSTYNVLGHIQLGYDRDHVLIACCNDCKSYLHLYKCPICSTFFRNSFSSYPTPNNIHPTMIHNAPLGGYTIHGYDDNDNYDTYDNCCIDCHQKRVWENTPHQYDTCESCGDLFLADDMYWSDDDDCYYCEDCYNERQAEIEAEREAESYDCYDDEWHEVEAINDYHGGNHSQRDLGDALMFGAEYEIKCFDLYDDTYDRERFCDGLAKHGSITRDGSVDLEIVTKPMTLPDLRQNILDLATFCAENHVRAWNGGYCGLHIHINRGGISNFTNIYHFLRDNKDKLHLLSGREFTSSATHYCQFDFPADDDELLKECNNYTRYLAVNLQNEKTVEFRFFRNTTKKERLEAYFDFLKVLFENDNDLDKMTWEDLIRKTDNDFLYDMFSISKQCPLSIAE